ncbi:hypothetical protein NEFER03_0898 [Nematocida sp. LUAm3]|nr:hypothetical protein NEFER03_0898 [Nematocida sp. LUAm3]KAI5174916.1 hypothetical protein NEFER02_1016 [Nematocida sp. LUAm2]KAI5177485.1 hypothetical protein NEFER01_0735 [Nematocida sp. LUAm1]
MEVIVQFKSKKDKDLVTPPTQVPQSMSKEEMEEYLNKILNADKTYAFFYQGEQIFKVPDGVPEQLLEIEFLAVSKIHSESSKVEMDNSITSISIRRNPSIHGDSITICTVSGEAKELSISPGMETITVFESFKPIRAVTSSLGGIFTLTTTNKVVEAQTKEIVYSSDIPIISISSSENLLSIALSSSEILIFDQKTEIKKIKLEEEIGKVIMRHVDNKCILIVGTVQGTIEIFSVDTWKKKTIKLSRPITALGYMDERIYAAELGGLISICTLNKKIKEFQSDVDFISRIEAGTVFFAYTNQNMIYIRDKDSYVGTHLIEMDVPVSDMKISGKRLFVASASSLKMFNIFDE